MSSHYGSFSNLWRRFGSEVSLNNSADNPLEHSLGAENFMEQESLRGRVLDSFAEDWQVLVDWLEKLDQALNRFLRRESMCNHEDVQRYERRLSQKQPRYYSMSRLGASLVKRCSKSDQEYAVLNGMTEELANKWTGCFLKISNCRRQTIEDLLEEGKVADACLAMMNHYSDIGQLLDDENIKGDTDTTAKLVEAHQERLENFRQNLEIVNMIAAKSTDSMATIQVNELANQQKSIMTLLQQHQADLENNARKSNQYMKLTTTIMEFISKVDRSLPRTAKYPNEELELVEKITELNDLGHKITAMQQTLDELNTLGQEILGKCHPSALRFMKHYQTSTHSRWKQMEKKVTARMARMEQALNALQGKISVKEALLTYLSEAEGFLFASLAEKAPMDSESIEQILHQQMIHHEELQAKKSEIQQILEKDEDEIDAELTYSKKIMDSGKQKTNYPLLSKWQRVWTMSLEWKEKLSELLTQQREKESTKNFNFETWRIWYLNWVRANKGRRMDFFRANIDPKEGTINRQAFINGMLECGFTTTRAELNVVFDTFDTDKSGSIDYQEFMEALHRSSHEPGRSTARHLPKILDDVEKEMTECRCRNPYLIERVEGQDGKYLMGEHKKAVLTRSLHSTTMVRVGGGWETLTRFLSRHDPCRVMTSLTTSPLYRRHGSLSPHPGSDGGYSSDTGFPKRSVYGSTEQLGRTRKKKRSGIPILSRVATTSAQNLTWLDRYEL